MKTKNSEQLFEKSKHHIAGGVNSPVHLKVLADHQFFLKNHEVAIYTMKMAINI